MVLHHIVTTNQWLVFINDTGNLFIAINDKFLVVLTKLNNTNNILRILSCEDKEVLNPVGKFESFEISKWWYSEDRKHNGQNQKYNDWLIGV